MELNAATARLVREVTESDAGIAEVLERLAAEWGMEADRLGEFGWQQLGELNRLGALCIVPESVA